MNPGQVWKWAGLALVVLGLAGSAHAQDKLPASNAQATVPPDWPPPLPPVPTAAKPESVLGTDDLCLYQLLEQVQEGTFFARGEFLLWTPRRRAFDFAFVDPNQAGTAIGSLASLGWSTNAGLRVGGGYRLSPDGWEIAGTYTYFHSSGDSALVKPPGGTLVATLTHPGFVDSVDTAVAGSSVNYQVFDVDLGRRFQTSPSFTGYLGGGGRFAWIDQSFNAFYNGQTAAQDQVSSPIRFNGAGLRFGGEGQWNVLGGFGVYGKAFGSMLVGNYNNSLTETNNNGATIITALSDQFRKIVPVAEMALGLAWQGPNMRARFGYELSNWFNLVDSPDVVHDFSNKYSRRVSDFSLDGLSVMFEWNY